MKNIIGTAVCIGRGLYRKGQCFFEEMQKGRLIFKMNMKKYKMPLLMKIFLKVWILEV